MESLYRQDWQFCGDVMWNFIYCPIVMLNIYSWCSNLPAGLFTERRFVRIVQLAHCRVRKTIRRFCERYDFVAWYKPVRDIRLLDDIFIYWWIMRSNLFFRSMWINSSEKKCTFTFNWEKNATMINTLTSLRLFFALMVFGAHCYVVDSTFQLISIKRVL